MGESFDHCPAGWIRQSRKCCIQFIHNRMVVDCRSMSTANFAIFDYCSLISLNLTLALNHIHGDECSIAISLTDESPHRVILETHR
jgi:hypothetical protein